jgi:DNA-binding response OmpR family regulator
VEPEYGRPLSVIVAAEETMRQHLVAMLVGGLRARVQEAQDSWDIVSTLLTMDQPADLVVSDLQLLHGRGLDLIVSLRAAAIEVPFLLITTTSAPMSRALSTRLDALVLEKPVLASELLAGVRRLCGVPGRPCDPGRTAA